MSIRNLGKKINQGLDNSLFLSIVIILIASASFGLGRLSKIEDSRIPIKFIDNSATVLNSTVGKGSTMATGKYVSSINGSKYHLPWCSGAQRIKEENKIWFNTAEEAKNAGYEPAANCKGI